MDLRALAGYTCAALTVMVVTAGALGAQQPAPTAPADRAAVERGQKLLADQCGFCHGDNARGGSGGPDLTRLELVQSDEGGKQLAEFLAVGRPDAGATNWPPPSFSPDTGLLYFGTRQTFSVMYLTDTDGRPQGWAAAERNVGNVGNALKAIDYKTGKVKWSRPFASGPAGTLGGPVGLLSTAGGLLFGNDGGGNFVAYDAATGKPLWHAGLGTNTSNGPQTYLLDGRQHIVVGAGDTLYAFALQP